MCHHNMSLSINGRAPENASFTRKNVLDDLLLGSALRNVDGVPIMKFFPSLAKSVESYLVTLIKELKWLTVGPASSWMVAIL